MQFHRGATIFTSDGKEVARVDRIVVDPATNLVTHLVLRKGRLFSVDKVVPIELITAGANGALIVQLKGDELSRLADYEEKQYVIADEHALTPHPHPDPLAPAETLYYNPLYPEPPLAAATSEPALIQEVKTNTPDGTVAIKAGAKVYSYDDQPIGHVDLVLTSPSPERVTHLLISYGMLRRDHRLVPVRWIANWHEDEVRLAITAGMFDSLPNYEMAH